MKEKFGASSLYQWNRSSPPNSVYQMPHPKWFSTSVKNMCICTLIESNPDISKQSGLSSSTLAADKKQEAMQKQEAKLEL